MNLNKYIAEINWLSSKDGGRISDIPFNTNKYAPRIVIAAMRENWSLVVNNFKRLSPLKTMAIIYYLNVSAAPDNLYVGVNFELFEGNRKVAFGTIVERYNK